MLYLPELLVCCDWLNLRTLNFVLNGEVSEFAKCAVENSDMTAWFWFLLPWLSAAPPPEFLYGLPEFGLRGIIGELTRPEPTKSMFSAFCYI